MTKAKAGFELAISDLNAKMLTTTLCTRATINIDAFRLEYDFIVESALVHLCRMQIKVKFFFLENSYLKNLGKSRVRA